jgi:hypothetical protein
MLRFMVIGAPRSGTAWAANWLTSDGYLCLHDPLWDHHYGDLDQFSDPKTGISCTGIAYFPDWVNQHPARKVILHRPRHEVQASLDALGLPPCPQKLFDNLWQIRGLHVEWRSLFTLEAAGIHKHLRLGYFDPIRWKMLKDMRITANYQKRKQNPEVWARIQAEGALP